jgi:hypothetical protein
VQGLCKPSAESVLFAEVQPILAAHSQNALQNYAILAK